ncbi:tyrosine-protein phosphatase non-receptor type substrate 1-like [Protopterus annectens]|uniref:tyrosine-protein phosphatase non-receptor type substrate 1-like n=1 Tax=Protopterus annectens TaxID=7888 RepID=UPI001CFA86F5|nr:tyrosine-protein phosphatase non-receptor type substrate 1-like [Protopterus annectens]
MQCLACTLEFIFLLKFVFILKATYGKEINQTASVTGIEGGAVIMNCSLSEESVGSVRWYKGSNQQILFSQLSSDKSDSRVRVTAVDELARNIMSITFTNITLDDAGLYYCVKLKSDNENVSASGSQTQLFVNSKYKTVKRIIRM